MRNVSVSTDFVKQQTIVDNRAIEEAKGTMK